MQLHPRIHAIGEALAAVDRPLPRVEYHFTCEAAPDVIWRVRHVTLDEGLSQPYELVLDLLVDDTGLDPDSLLASNCDLSVDRHGVARSVCGVISRVELHDRLEDQQPIRVVVVPALRLLEQRVDTRLWQRISALAIVEEILGEALAVYDRELDTSRLQAEYEPREYVVQYHESDLDFVSRLLEDEGISYHFDHDRGTGREVMVLEDSCDHWPQITTLDDDSSLTIITTRAHEAEVESIQRLTWAGALRPTAVVRRTFDWFSPREPTIVRAGGSSDDPGGRELYHHGRVVEADPEPRVVRELAHARAGGLVLRGVGNAIGLAPGRRFRVAAEDRPELDHELMVVRQRVQGDCPDAQLGEDDGDLDYVTQFECVRFTPEPWSPPLRTSTPKIHGPQTALVTGPEGEEIHTDEHGRVKLRFAWDRQHELSDDSSMWVRVAQGWAGGGFGMLFIPRVGMEVVVEFISGDPDRPLVTGCVYNPDTAASISLPDAKTQSTIRTRSSPGGDGYNELRFEDAAGSEQILVHAQRDLREEIGRNRTTTIANQRSETIGGDHRQTVRGDQTLVMEKHRSEHVKGGEDVTHDGHRCTRIYGEERLTVDKLTMATHKGWVTRSITGRDETVVYETKHAPALSRTKAYGDIELDATRTLRACAGDRMSLAQGESTPRAQMNLEKGAIEQHAEKTWQATAGTEAELRAGTSLKLDGSELAELRQDQAAVRIEGNVVSISGKSIELVVGDNKLVITERGLEIIVKAFDVAAETEAKIRAASIFFD